MFFLSKFKAFSLSLSASYLIGVFVCTVCNYVIVLQTGTTHEIEIETETGGETGIVAAMTEVAEVTAVTGATGAPGNGMRLPRGSETVPPPPISGLKVFSFSHN